MDRAPRSGLSGGPMVMTCDEKSRLLLDYRKSARVFLGTVDRLQEIGSNANRSGYGDLSKLSEDAKLDRLVPLSVRLGRRGM